MLELKIDATRCQSADDVFDALFQAWKAPDWHGRNFNALRDSLLTGDINQVEPPFRMTIIGVEMAGPAARDLLVHFKDFIREQSPALEAAGRTVELRFVKGRAS